jgi:hypothetical protein
MTTHTNIEGIIMQPFYENCLFTGHLTCQNDGSFNGELYDTWGDSKIEGMQNEEEMSFRKEYNRRGDLIFYSFKKEGDIWIGSFKGSITGVGEAQCEIYDEKPRADWNARVLTERFSIETAEANAQYLTKKMIEQGFLRVFTDPKTGKEMIELTEKARLFQSPDKN